MYTPDEFELNNLTHIKLLIIICLNKNKENLNLY